MALTNRQVINDVLMEKARTDKDIVVLCSDSRGSASLTPFAETYPDQFVEMGIAEQDLVTVAAGLALSGKKAFAASPASFLSTRSYEQAKVDVAYSRSNVKLIGISGGISYGALGMTHHSCQDIAAMAALPDMRVYIPSDAHLTRLLMEALAEDTLPAYIRVSRSATPEVYTEGDPAFTLDQTVRVREGRDVLIVACGDMVPNAVAAAEELEQEGIHAGIMDAYCLKPFDSKTLLEMASDVKLVVSAEEHAPHGGLGSIVAQVLCQNAPKKMLQIALPDGHISSGTNTEVFQYYGMDGAGIASQIRRVLE